MNAVSNRDQSNTLRHFYNYLIDNLRVLGGEPTRLSRNRPLGACSSPSAPPSSRSPRTIRLNNPYPPHSHPPA